MKGKIKRLPALLLALLPGAMIYGIDDRLKAHAEQGGLKAAGDDKAVTFGLLHNDGMAYGILKKKPGLVKYASVFMTVFSVISLVRKIFRYKGNRSEAISLAGQSVLLGGACSNSMDRMKKGYVVDYVRFPRLPGRFSRLMFNISDFAIFIGVVLGKIR